MLPVKLIQPLPEPGDAGFFGAERKHDIHTGIDLYTEDDAEVYAIKTGTVVAIEAFTGEHADSPWWNNTWAILIENNKGVICYGEVTPHPLLKVGDKVRSGQLIGNVKRVLKGDKGKNPPSMLHFEFYTKGTRKTVWWKLGEPCPENLRNPLEVINTLVYHRYVKIFPDYMASGVWDWYGSCCDLNELPVSDRVKELINSMAIDFDSCEWIEYNGECHYTCPEGINYFWDERSKEIVAEIKKELPDWKVLYNE